MAFMDTGDITIPSQLIAPWLGKVQNGSAVAALSQAIPMLFGAGTTMTFDIGEAEYVAEGANKGPSTITPTTKTVTPFKFHKTVRWTEEVMWADEDHQLGVVSQILDLMAAPLARALDYGVFHEVNPATGVIVAAMNGGLTDTTNVVEYVSTDAPYVSLDAADALVLADGYAPRDIALDPEYAAKFTALRGTNSEQKLYPNLQYGTQVSELDGHRAFVSNTVGATGLLAVDTDVLAFVGDFSTVRWGIQRNIPVEIIRHGDPDGQGDLKRNNQIAFRAEIVYGWGIGDLNAIAKVHDLA